MSQSYDWLHANTSLQCVVGETGAGPTCTVVTRVQRPCLMMSVTGPIAVSLAVKGAAMLASPGLTIGTCEAKLHACGSGASACDTAANTGIVVHRTGCMMLGQCVSRTMHVPPEVAFASSRCQMQPRLAIAPAASASGLPRQSTVREAEPAMLSRKPLAILRHLTDHHGASPRRRHRRHRPPGCPASQIV